MAQDHVVIRVANGIWGLCILIFKNFLLLISNVVNVES